MASAMIVSTSTGLSMLTHAGTCGLDCRLNLEPNKCNKTVQDNSTQETLGLKTANAQIEWI